jgi:hypothetical protein
LIGGVACPVPEPIVFVCGVPPPPPAASPQCHHAVQQSEGAHVQYSTGFQANRSPPHMACPVPANISGLNNEGLVLKLKINNEFKTKIQ